MLSCTLNLMKPGSDLAPLSLADQSSKISDQIILPVSGIHHMIAGQLDTGVQVYAFPHTHIATYKKSLHRRSIAPFDGH